MHLILNRNDEVVVDKERDNRGLRTLPAPPAANGHPPAFRRVMSQGCMLHNQKAGPWRSLTVMFQGTVCALAVENRARAGDQDHHGFTSLDCSVPSFQRAQAENTNGLSLCDIFSSLPRPSLLGALAVNCHSLLSHHHTPFLRLALWANTHSFQYTCLHRRITSQDIRHPSPGGLAKDSIRSRQLTPH